MVTIQLQEIQAWCDNWIGLTANGAPILDFWLEQIVRIPEAFVAGLNNETSKPNGRTILTHNRIERRSIVKHDACKRPTQRHTWSYRKNKNQHPQQRGASASRTIKSIVLAISYMVSNGENRPSSNRNLHLVW